MIASKEQAKKAAEILAAADRRQSAGKMYHTLTQEDYVILSDFITAAGKRLPTEAAIEKDRKRKQIYHEGRKNAKAPQGVPA